MCDTNMNATCKHGWTHDCPGCRAETAEYALGQERAMRTEAEAKLAKAEACCALWSSVFQKYESFLANGRKLVAINDVIYDYQLCKKLDCAKDFVPRSQMEREGWLPPDKAKEFEDRLRQIELTAEEYNFIGWQRIVGVMRQRASEALAAIQKP